MGGIRAGSRERRHHQQFTITNPTQDSGHLTNVSNSTSPPHSRVSSAASMPSRSASAISIPMYYAGEHARPGQPSLPSDDVPAFNFPTNSLGNPVSPIDRATTLLASFQVGLVSTVRRRVASLLTAFRTDLLTSGSQVLGRWCSKSTSRSHTTGNCVPTTPSRRFSVISRARSATTTVRATPASARLFDFTNGNFNQLGGQTTPGVLNQNRQQVANVYFSYVFDHGMLKNLTLGTGVNIQTGTPITELAAHPVYLNSSEIPIGGRGALGNTPTTGTVNFPFGLLVEPDGAVASPLRC